MLENGTLEVLNMQEILPNRFQPRIHFDEIGLKELAESIRKYGVIQPIVVRRIGNKYEIIAGERRYKANFLANKSTIPAIVLNLSDKESEEIALLENVQRQNLTPIEEAVSYKKILDTGYITQEQLAQKLGKTQSTIANKIRLLNLDDIVQESLLKGKISERHARSLLRIHNKERQVEMLSRIINERLTVKRTDEAIDKILENKEQNQQRKTIPVASHQIIKVSPPKEFIEKERKVNNMDIDKILNEAQDINTPPVVKGPDDIAGLMNQPAGANPTPPAETQLEQNKFIHVEQPTPVNTPIENPTPQVSFDSVFNQQPVSAVNQTPLQTSPTLEEVNSSFNLPQTNQGVQETTPMQQIPTPQPMPSTTPIDASPLPTPEAVSPVNMTPSVDLPQNSPTAINNIPSINIENDIQTPIAPIENPNNLMQAVNLIRDCAKKVEALGYGVDVDEINMDNLYQVIFKIRK